MLKARKRISKRQMKQDKLVTYYFKTVDYLQNQSRNLIWTLGAILIVILAIFIFSRKQAEKEQKAITALTEARAEYAGNNFEAAEGKLQNLINSYGGTKSGQIATFYLANSKFHLQKYEAAEKLFRKYIDEGEDEILRASAYSGVAACLEEQGKFHEAAEMYQTAAKKSQDEFMTPKNLYDSARCYSLAGNKEAAREALQTLINEYSQSQIKNDAETLLAQLSY
ncbi:tetratricopeptide repeat protein [candidate division KSB1 bacterium]|nr:tetratricopeptide repeat protein [candidate division KSB1 bacterium]NIR70422.1 tetratricopeptide repeat protein [candidate division KSB1 bacterium]NIS25962.1 tetratricopeptide repeat protein [candidate division KSB1 bacterium]NIT69985.1 tetratricopeptide repeat protein [candidate division KSB1 bacterium]NIU26650.1 tetratricopeptide repeat protein [candidate division KSB1 bacterium]